MNVSDDAQTLFFLALRFFVSVGLAAAGDCEPTMFYRVSRRA
jgi:hypothetical protein